MKRLIALLTLVLLGVMLGACSSSSTPPTTTPPATTPSTTPSQTTPPPTQTTPPPPTTPPVTTPPPYEPIVNGDTVTVFGDANPFSVLFSASDAVGREAAGVLTSKLASLGFDVASAKADTSKTESACELLIGETSRAISASAKSAIAVRIASAPQSLHWVWLYSNGQLALYANNAEAYATAIAELSSKYLVDGKIQFKTNAKNIGTVKVPQPMIVGGLAVVFGGSEDFTIVYGSDDAKASGVAANLSSLLAGQGLSTPAVSLDTNKVEMKCELLIGETSRALSLEAMTALEEKIAAEPHDDHWLWLYKNGQLALVANTDAAYEAALAELTSTYFADGKVKFSTTTNVFGLIRRTHDAYMEYSIPNNFYDGYTDPFNMSANDYKSMTVTKVSAKLYRISYTDELGGVFTADLVQKNWGLWAMGATSYTEPDGTLHNMTSSSTDYEYVFKIGAKTPLSFRSGNHGDYPGDKNWQYFGDDSSLSNDRLLDMTFYDGKSGEKITLTAVGDSVTVNGLRIVMHHNIYEMNYTQANVLMNAERSYLYNGTDIHLDTKFYVAQKVNLGRGYSCMLPIWKEYGNCAIFYREDGSSYFMKTLATAGGKDDVSLGIPAVSIDIWGENNPECHFKISINNPSDMNMSSVDDGKTGYTGIRDMQAGTSNKIYCSLFSEEGTLGRGDELHFNTTWSFSYEPDFVNPTTAPDRWVGTDGN